MLKSLLYPLALSLIFVPVTLSGAAAYTRSPHVSPMFTAMIPLSPLTPDDIGFIGTGSMSPAHSPKPFARVASFRNLTQACEQATAPHIVMSLLRQHPAPVAAASSTPASPMLSPFSSPGVHASGTPLPISRHDIPTSKSMNALGGC